MTKPIRVAAVGMFAIAGGLLAIAYGTRIPQPNQVHTAPRPLPAALQAVRTIPPPPVARFADCPDNAYPPLESYPQPRCREPLGDPPPPTQRVIRVEQPDEFSHQPQPVDAETFYGADRATAPYQSAPNDTPSDYPAAAAQSVARADGDHRATASTVPRDYEIPAASVPTQSADNDAWHPSPTCIQTIGDDQHLAHQRAAPSPPAAGNETEQIPLDTSPIVVKLPGTETPIATIKLVSSSSSTIPLHNASHQRPARYSAVIDENSVAQSSLYIDIDANTGNSTFEARNIGLTELLRLAADRTGIDIEYGRHVRGLISAKITDKPLVEALTEIVAPFGFEVRQRRDRIIVDLPGMRDLKAPNQARLYLKREGEAPAEPLSRSFVPAQQEVGPPAWRRGRRLGTKASIPGRAPVKPATERIDSAVSCAREQATVVDSAVQGKPARLTSEPTVRSAPAALLALGIDEPSDPLILESPKHADASENKDRLTPNDAAAHAAGETRTQGAEREKTMMTSEQAMHLMRNAEYTRAVNLLSEAATECYDSAQLFSLLGEAYYHVGNYTAARVAIERSLELYKYDARTNFFMGCVLEALHQTARGHHYFLQAHDLDPMYPPRKNESSIAPR